jgi:hypothetical protein
VMEQEGRGGAGRGLRVRQQMQQDLCHGDCQQDDLRFHFHGAGIRALLWIQERCLL